MILDLMPPSDIKSKITNAVGRTAGPSLGRLTQQV
jgi:hypothetical protein